jgi:6-pyruvoyltetrahydropterin/6-carboxytetrahydropterin synthase
VVDLEFRPPRLDADNLVVHIGLSSRALRAVLAEFAYRNLDEHPGVAGHNTTTEFMASRVFEGVAGRIAAGELGESARGIQSLRLLPRESHLAWAAYESELPT